MPKQPCGYYNRWQVRRRNKMAKYVKFPKGVKFHCFCGKNGGTSTKKTLARGSNTTPKCPKCRKLMTYGG